MAYDGQLKFDTSVDTKGFEQATGRMGDIIKGSLISQAIGSVFQMIVGQVDAAMGRLDTFAQFNRVMTTLTGSADLAGKALERVNDTVTGTAFGLDVAAAAVQNFVASGMSVNHATDTISAWSDAVAFYTKGTNADLESVTQALAKMQTRGTITMREMQQLLYAGIPAMDIYASAIGVSTAEVAAQMSNGELKTEDFINAMNAAFTTGTTKFPAIAGTAKQAGTSWAGSIDNMKAAVTRGVGAILESFDNMFNVKSGMVQFGKALETVLKGIAANLHIIIPLVTTSVAAFAAYKIATAAAGALNTFRAAQAAIIPVTKMVIGMQQGQTLTQAILATEGVTLSAVQATQAAVLRHLAKGNVEAALSEGTLTAAQSVQTAVMGVLTGKISLATAAQYLWNAALAANPIFIVVAAVAAAVAAITVLTNILRENNESWKESRDNVDRLTEAQSSLTDSLDASADAYKNAATEMRSNTLYANTLLQQLDSLDSEYDNTADKMAAVQNIANQLNGTYEGLNLTVDEQTGALSMARDELERYITLQNKANAATAEQDRYNQLLNEQAQIQAQITETEAAMVAIYNDENLSFFDKVELLKDLQGSYDELTKAQKTNAAQLEAHKNTTVETLTGEEQAAMNYYEALNGAVDANGDNVEALAAKYGLATSFILGEIQKTGQSVAEWSEEQARKMDESGRSIVDYAHKWGVSVAEIQAWMDEHNAGLDAWAEHMDESTTDAGLTIEQLAAKWGTTVKAIEQEMFKNGMDLQAWSDAQDDKLQEWEDAFDTHSENVINDFEELPTKLDISAQDMARILQENAAKYQHWQELLTQAAQYVSGDVIAEMQRMGVGTTSALEEIIADAGGPLAEQMNEAFRSMTETSVDAANREAGRAVEIGETYVDQYQQGIMDNQSTAEKAAETTVVATLDTMSSSIFESKSRIQSAWETIRTTIISTMMPLADRMYDVMSNVTSAMVRALNAGAGAVYAKASAIAEGVLSRTKRAYQIKSPSRAMQQIYEMLIRGGWVGMDRSEGSLFNKATDVSEGVLERLSGIPESLAAAFNADMQDSIGMMHGRIAAASPIYAAGGPMLAAQAAGATTYTTNVTFNEPANQPDVIARKVSQIQRYGLAGRRQ